MLQAPCLLNSPALTSSSGIRHGFFTREGGVSTGIYAALNCGLGSNDDCDTILRNRALAAEAMGVTAERLITAYQVHSPDVVTVTKPWAPGEGPQVDGMVTAEAGIVLGILTADCAPLLFMDEKAGVIGAAHAGWKGAVSGVAERTIAAMEELGADRTRIHAAIGPCIAQVSYEVSAEFQTPFLAGDPANADFFSAGNRPGHLQFDLPGYLLRRLKRAGITKAEWIGLDTCADEARFFSYRRKTLRNEPDYARGLSAIVLG